MELSWLMKLRIAAAAVIGVVMVGILAWPGDAAADPYGSVMFRTVDTSGAVTLFIMAFLASLITYFAAWPYGSQIGILAVPFGLTVWAVRAGTAGALMQFNPTVEQRLMVLGELRWESFFWLAVVALGFAGVTLGQKIRPATKPQNGRQKELFKYNYYINPLLAVVATVYIAQICIRYFARDVILSDNRLNSIVGQPPIGQIVFAVLVSFGVAAFVVKKILNVSYIWPIVASSFVIAFSVMSYDNQPALGYIVEQWPAVLFSDAVISVLPVQMVAFGALGSIWGYWMAVRYQFGRKQD